MLDNAAKNVVFYSSLFKYTYLSLLLSLKFGSRMNISVGLIILLGTFSTSYAGGFYIGDVEVELEGLSVTLTWDLNEDVFQYRVSVTTSLFRRGHLRSPVVLAA